jgi:hypothetical protein
MSRENVEVVRLAYEEAYVRRSVEGLRERFDENFVLHSRPEFPGRPLYWIDQIEQMWADLDDTFIEFSLVPEDFALLGEYVIVTVRQSARMRASDARIDGTVYHVWHVQAGKPREMWVRSDRKSALEAVGLSE